MKLQLLLLCNLGLGATLVASPQCPTDPLEPNDSCATAAVVGPGMHTGLTAEAFEPDYLRVTVPSGHRLQVNLQVVQAPADFGGFVSLVRGDGSASPCDSFDNNVHSDWIDASQGGTTLGWSTSALAPEDFWIVVDVFGQSCLHYDLAVSVFPEPCEATPDTGIEDNDSCLTAAPVGPGLYGGQRVSIMDPDYYQVVAAPGELITIAVTESSGSESFSLWAWNADAGVCGQLASAATGFAGFPAGLYLFNEGDAPRTYVVQVQPTPNQAAQTGFCIDYVLEVSSDTSPCLAWTLDTSEPNDSCSAPSPLTGPVTGRGMRSSEHDWYSIPVQPRSTLRVLATPVGTIETRSMMLFSGCSGNPDFLNSDVPVYHDGLESRTWMQWTNSGDQAQDTLLFLWRNVSYPHAFCTEYDLDVSFTLGEPFCLVKRNSTGEGARVTASGSTAVGQGTLDLSMAPVPAGQFGLFFFGPAQQPSSSFGNGYLCVSGSMVRLPVASTGSGALVTSIDWSDPRAAGVIGAGQDWFFQGWFRDPAAGGASFNLSEGLRLSFQ